jgi:hypothetical protein
MTTAHFDYYFGLLSEDWYPELPTIKV